MIQFVNTPNENPLNLKSDAVKEMLGKIPHWIIRWGTSLVFIVIALILVGAWFIRYPDIISTKVQLTTENPPKPLIARASGNIKLLVDASSEVKQNEPIAFIKNAADEKDILYLTQQMETLEDFVNTLKLTPEIYLPPNPSLGEVQQPYSTFAQAVDDFRFFDNNPYYDSRIRTINTQINNNNTGKRDLSGQLELLQREVRLIENKYETNKILYQKGAISKISFEAIEVEYLERKRQLEALKGELTSYNIQHTAYQENLLDLQQQYNQEAQRHQTTLRDSFRRLKSALQEWQLKYFLRSPSEGMIAFNKINSDNQFVHEGEEIFSVLPSESETGEIVGRIYLPQQGIGKIKVGQRVRIKLDGFASHEFGILNGKVINISSVARPTANSAEESFMTLIEVPQDLQTSYSKKITFKQGMTGTAEIITQDHRLLERFMNQLKALFNNN